MRLRWINVTNKRHPRAKNGKALAFDLKHEWLEVGIQDFDGVWGLNCHQIGIENMPLKTKSPRTAKEEAMAIVRARMLEMISTIGDVT